MKTKIPNNPADFPDSRLGGREYISILQSILYNSPTGIALLDISSHFILMNEALANTLSVPKSTSVGKTIKELIPWSENQLEQEVKKVIKTGKPKTNLELTTKALSKEGARYFNVSLYPCKNRAGQIVSLGFMLNEITDLRLSQEQVEASNKKFRSILESIGEGLIVTDERGDITLINPAAETMLKLGSMTLIGKPPLSVIGMVDAHNNPIPDKFRPITQALKTGEKIVTKDYYYTRPDGTKFPVHTTTTPIELQGKLGGTIVVFRDITQEKAIDQAKSEFVSLASHQLRTPLTIIKWFTARLLATDWDKMSENDKRDYIEKIYKTNERMVELVNAILNVSRVETGTLSIQPQQVNVQATCESVIAEFSTPIQNKKLSIQTQFAKKLPIIFIGPELLRIIFLNLLSNAIKYTPEHGSITIKLETKNDHILIVCRDTGIGINKEQQEFAFTKFFRTEQAKKIDPEGNGLGLYIIKAIIKEIGGSINLVSEKNKGTTFSISLPVKSTNKKGVTTLIESKT